MREDGSIPTPSGVSIPGELVARLEVASEGSLELSDAVMEAAHNIHDGPYAHWPSAARAFGWDCLVTTSLDAAIALAERVLPGWMRNFDELNGGHWVAGLFDRASLAHRVATAPTPALALCIAILKAATTPSSPHQGAEQ